MTPIAGPLLETKLYIPGVRRALVPRPRLTAGLNRGAESKLTLVSAPAGFGKTTLLTAWLAAAPANPRSVAWLSLDQRDNQPALFWTYLIAALQTVAPGIGASAIALLQSPQPPPVETVLALLLNELSGISNEVVLVLDDYHVIDARDIHAGMVFLLDHLPPRLHLVIAGRADPTLPLARLRARGELVELRAADLRFTPDEAAAYLNEVMQLELAPPEVAALEGRTEGWIAALQLAALSMQGRDDTAGFIAGFAGDDRYIVDYLVEEVLQRQPEPVRSFLLHTSILDRLIGPLCNAVTGQDSGKAMLEALDRGNLFVVPLDDRRRWYRYHHLFAAVVQSHLIDEQPDVIPDLHRRASEWLAHNGEPAEAIRHALAAEDFPRVADLAEQALPAMRRNRQAATMLGWLQALPDDVVHFRPVLSGAYAWGLLETGQLAAVEARLQDAEHWLGPLQAPDGSLREPQHSTADPNGRPAQMIVVDEAEFRRLPGMIAVYRAAHAQALGNLPAATKYARRVLDLVPEDELLLRGSASAILGLACWSGGDLAAAHQMYADGMAYLLKAGNISDAISGAMVLAEIRTVQGRLRDAARTYAQSMQLATEQGEPAPRGTADVHVGLSELQRERNDLPAATQHLLTSQELGERTGMPRDRSGWCVVMARIQAAHGDLDGALSLLQEADRLLLPGFFPDARPVAALRTRLWVKQGRLDEAIGWARERGLSVDDDLSYVREFEHITLARILLARREIVAASGLLERLLKAAEQGDRTGSAIEILVLQALARQVDGDLAAALAPLGRALALAEPEGYVRIFVDEGPSMAALLAAAKHRIAPNYVRQLLTALGQAEGRTPVKHALSEPLSERELEVLRLLGTDLDGPEIARELVVSLNTMRTHTKNIYAKLGVSTRRAAVRRGAELEL